MMTSAQVFETSVNITNNSPSRDYSYPNDQTTQTTETPGFKPFTDLNFLLVNGYTEKYGFKEDLFYCACSGIILQNLERYSFPIKAGGLTRVALSKQGV